MHDLINWSNWCREIHQLFLKKCRNYIIIIIAHSSLLNTCISYIVSPAVPLSAGAAISISVVITFIVTIVIGFLSGLLVMHLCSRKKAVYSPATEGQANVGPTAPAGPVYEEVSPKEEIELNNNQAYGPVGLWNLQDYSIVNPATGYSIDLCIRT